MKKTKILSFVLVNSTLSLFFAMCLTNTANALLLDFHYGGKVVKINDDNSFIDSIQAGDEFSGQFTLDSEVSDNVPSIPDVGFYIFSPRLTSFSAMISMDIWAAAQNSHVSAIVFNNNNLPAMRDLFILQSFNIDVGSNTGEIISSAMRLDLGDFTMAAFTDDSLPGDFDIDLFDSGTVIDAVIFPPLTTAYPSLNIDVVIEQVDQEPRVSIGYQILGQILNIELLSPVEIPVPSSLLLFIIGLLTFSYWKIAHPNFFRSYNLS